MNSIESISLDTPEQTENPRILVIEDNIDVAESLSDALEMEGYQTVVAHDGPSGIEKARSFHPEAILCDIGLPEMDGYEVARRMRADESLQGVFLIALSGYARPQDVEAAIQAGFDEHVRKPADLHELEEVLEHHFASR
jgi:two-component system CheB/CheR fusion protein